MIELLGKIPNKLALVGTNSKVNLHLLIWLNDLIYIAIF